MRVKIISEITSVSKGMLPEMKMMAPNSPRLRTNDKAMPLMSAGYSTGSTTRLKVCQPDAPRLAAASSYSGPRSSSTGCTERTTKGMVVNSMARTMPASVYETLMPNGSSSEPTQPLVAKSADKVSPATAVGNANGRSMSASSRRRPGNR